MERHRVSQGWAPPGSLRLEGCSAGPLPASPSPKSRESRGHSRVGSDGGGEGLRLWVPRRHLLEPALAVLALVPYPARVAQAGGVDTATREAGASPLAGLGLGHLSIERQVEEAIAQQPAVPVQLQPGGGAPDARPPSPAQPRGGQLRGTRAGPAPRLHLPGARATLAGGRVGAHGDAAEAGIPAADDLAAAAAPQLLSGDDPRPAVPSGATVPGRGGLRSAASGHARASPPALLTLSSASPTPQPRQLRGAEHRTAGARRSGGDPRGRGPGGEGEGTRAAPPRPRPAPTAWAPSAARPGGRGRAGAPSRARPRRVGGTRARTLASRRPPAVPRPRRGRLPSTC